MAEPMTEITAKSTAVDSFLMSEIRRGNRAASSEFVPHYFIRAEARAAANVASAPDDAALLEALKTEMVGARSEFASNLDPAEQITIAYPFGYLYPAGRILAHLVTGGKLANVLLLTNRGVLYLHRGLVTSFRSYRIPFRQDELPIRVLRQLISEDPLDLSTIILTSHRILSFSTEHMSAPGVISGALPSNRETELLPGESFRAYLKGEVTLFQGSTDLFVTNRRLAYLGYDDNAFVIAPIFVESAGTTIFIKDRNTDVPAAERNDTIAIRTEGREHVWHGSATQLLDIEDHLRALGFKILLKPVSLPARKVKAEKKRACGKCGGDLKSSDNTCPHCGYFDLGVPVVVVMCAVGLGAVAWSISADSWVWKSVAIVLAGLVLLATLIVVVDAISVKRKVRGASRPPTEFFANIVRFAKTPAGEQQPAPKVTCWRKLDGKACQGMIDTKLKPEADAILWSCSVCGANGILSKARGPKWSSVPGKYTGAPVSRA